MIFFPSQDHQLVRYRQGLSTKLSLIRLRVLPGEGGALQVETGPAFVIYTGGKEREGLSEERASGHTMHIGNCLLHFSLPLITVSRSRANIFSSKLFRMLSYWWEHFLRYQILIISYSNLFIFGFFLLSTWNLKWQLTNLMSSWAVPMIHNLKHFNYGKLQMHTKIETRYEPPCFNNYNILLFF